MLLFSTVLQVNQASAQDAGCDTSLEPVYSALSQAQAAWAAGNDEIALEALAQAQTQLEAIKTACGEQATVPSQEDNALCAASQWQFIPTGIYMGPESGGFKMFMVSFAYQNGSPYWGQFSGPYDTEDIYVTTEGGFQYPAVSHPGYDIPAPENVWVPDYSNFSSASNDILIPPGFSGQGYHDGDGYYSAPVVLFFNVAATQNHFVITVRKVRIWCLHADGEEVSEESGPLTFDLDTDMQTVAFPTSLPDSEIPDFAEPIEIPDKGTLEFLGGSRAEDNEVLVLRFRFTNASQGYETEWYTYGYVVGSDGLYTDTSSSTGISYYVGPGQSEEKEVEYPVGAETTGPFYLILAPQAAGTVPSIYKVTEQ